jgi:hypothetical protein
MVLGHLTQNLWPSSVYWELILQAKSRWMSQSGARRCYGRTCIVARSPKSNFRTSPCPMRTSVRTNTWWYMSVACVCPMCSSACALKCLLITKILRHKHITCEQCKVSDVKPEVRIFTIYAVKSIEVNWNKVVPVDDVKEYKGSRRLTPLIFNLGCKWMPVVNLTLRPLYPREITLVAGLRSCSDRCGV